MKKIVLLFIIATFAISHSVFAQQTYKVGDTVEFECSCDGPSEWRTGKIEKINPDGDYEVRYGTGRYSVWLARKNRVRPVGAGEQVKKQNEMREQFKKEANIYQESAFKLMYIHNPKLTLGSGYYMPPETNAEWTKVMADLTALDSLCKTKYAGMTNGKSDDETNIYSLPATWCEIAARRNEYQTKGRQTAAAYNSSKSLQILADKIKEAINGGYNGYIDEDIQLLVYEREKWRAIHGAKYEKTFKDSGIAVPSDFYKEVEVKADEFKAENARLAPTRSFPVPKHRDATVEAFIRGRYAAEKQGVQILKIGLDDANWIIHRNALGIPTSQTKVARLLVKVPNRPFCQEHSVAAERNYKGGRYGALSVDGGKIGEEGMFMKCE